jgi:hypothetical protein
MAVSQCGIKLTRASSASFLDCASLRNLTTSASRAANSSNRAYRQPQANYIVADMDMWQ